MGGASCCPANIGLLGNKFGFIGRIQYAAGPNFIGHSYAARCITGIGLSSTGEIGRNCAVRGAASVRGGKFGNSCWWPGSGNLSDFKGPRGGTITSR